MAQICIFWFPQAHESVRGILAVVLATLRECIAGTLMLRNAGFDHRAKCCVGSCTLAFVPSALQPEPKCRARALAGLLPFTGFPH